MSGPVHGTGTPPRGRAGRLTAVLALLVALAGCDDALKHVDTFSFMVDGPAIETYEQQPRPFPEGAVPLDGTRRYTLTEADTALSNPLESTTENIRQGRRAYTNFCLPCHGENGRGTGPVVNNSGNYPRRLPALPTLNLLSESARGLSDGYIYGMITNGRGVYMPSYRRIPEETRWKIVLYVRHLQRTASDTAAGGDRAAASSRASEQSSETDRE